MVGVEVAYIRLHTLALDFGAAIGEHKRMNAPSTPIRSFTLDNLLLFALGHLANLPAARRSA
jgi:hypothetical protein